MNARTAILATALAFVCALAGLTIAAAVRDGVRVLTFVSVLVLALLGCGVAGALIGGFAGGLTTRPGRPTHEAPRMAAGSTPTDRAGTLGMGELDRSGRLTVTVSPDRQSVVVTDLDEAVEAVRERGLRLTSARRLVLEALLAARGPISAEEIADGLGGRMTQSDIASVYRNLETLGSIGLVRHFHAGHGPGRYVLEGDSEREYLACESCGALESVDPAELDRVRLVVRELSGYEARFSHFPIVGLCPKCVKKAGRRGRAPQHRH